MFRIAICDDNIEDLSNIVSLVENYQSIQREPGNIQFTAFHNAVDFISAMESGQQYQVVLLDILMPHMTGMDVAKELRKFNQDIKIIFMTSSPEYAVESYAVNAYYYALKPIWKDKLFLLLDQVIEEMEDTSSLGFLVKSKSGLTRISIRSLEFAEIIGRTIAYHLTDGTVIEAVGSLQELEKEIFSESCFVKPHRSYIVNMEHIHTIQQRQIKMQSSAWVPLAKANSKAVKAEYIAFSFKE